METVSQHSVSSYLISSIFTDVLESDLIHDTSQALPIYKYRICQLACFTVQVHPNEEFMLPNNCGAVPVRLIELATSHSSSNIASSISYR